MARREETEADRVWKGYGLPPLSRKGGMAAVLTQVGSHLARVNAYVAEEEARLAALVEARANSVEDNRRWTLAAAGSKDAYRHAREFLRSYFAWLDDDEGEPKGRTDDP